MKNLSAGRGNMSAGAKIWAWNAKYERGREDMGTERGSMGAGAKIWAQDAEV
ncbi:hypothetical protein [Bacillus sp. OxB-1]|uniref:hypothetical protein n=1 Tax=Bacillus sp. (strain OxB-1) TaxID=98228 RepID=UPI000B128539|nr:hypothetical protein [Bacillus sp. OxB-1]